MPADPHLRAPDARLLGALALLAVVPSFCGGIGAHDMFTAPVEYRLDLMTLEADGFPTRVTPHEMAPHLSRDARRVMLPAHGWALGENAATQLVRAADDLTAYLCTWRRPHGARVVVRRRALSGGELPRVDRTRVCVP